jgi:signal transduction histidine kinase
MAPEVRARVRADLPGELPPVRGDGSQLEETWFRLLDNAAKFSAAGSPIDVRVGERGGRVMVEFTDFGVGIAPEDCERVFEPFCQVGRDQMIDKADGTGLGLTLAKSTIEGHGGTIVVTSTLGRGTTFRVTLPVQPESAAVGSD